MARPELIDKTKKFPKSPGVYLMKDSRGHIIYVGKAKDLRVRVRQYFGKHDSRYHVEFLMDRVRDINFIQTLSEKEALFLEGSLIKKHKPKYNLFLKDDKTYLSVKLTIQHDYPRLLSTRKVLSDNSLYYGPFTSADGVHKIKEFIYQHFQLRTCSDHEFKNRSRPCLEYQIGRCTAPCVGKISKQQYQEQVDDVKLFLEGKNKKLQKVVKVKMKTASESESFENAARYRDLLQNMTSLLEDQNVTRLSFEFSDILAFERQGKKVGIAVMMVRDSQLIDSKYFIVTALGDDQETLSHFIYQYYLQKSYIPKEVLLPLALENLKTLKDSLKEATGQNIHFRVPKKGERKELITLARQNLLSHFYKDKKDEAETQKLLQSLQTKLQLREIPKRIECYDISNISGKDAVGSMVVLENGKPNKGLYKKFKIKSLDTPDDYHMMAEVLKRRFQYQSKSWEHPQLLVVDGGKGQLNMAERILKELDLDNIDLVAIAKGKGPGARAKGDWQGKKNEELFRPGRKNPIQLTSKSPELKILQVIRDESHRFAITFHRKLREKRITQSWLDQVPGIGKQRKQNLIKAFGSPHKIANTKVEDLKKIKGITEKLAADILKMAPKER